MIEGRLNKDALNLLVKMHELEEALNNYERCALHCESVDTSLFNRINDMSSEMRRITEAMRDISNTLNHLFNCEYLNEN